MGVPIGGSRVKQATPEPVLPLMRLDGQLYEYAQVLL